jgi:hypothetical protein
MQFFIYNASVWNEGETALPDEIVLVGVHGGLRRHELPVEEYGAR